MSRFFSPPGDRRGSTTDAYAACSRTDFVSYPLYSFETKENMELNIRDLIFTFWKRLLEHLIDLKNWLLSHGKK